MEKIRVAIVDDQNLFRQSLSLLINTVPSLVLVSASQNAANFLTTLSDHALYPDILLLDLNMPDMNGMELNDFLQIHHPRIKVLILSVHAEERLIARMISAGASAYLIKNCDKEELISAIKITCETGFYVNKNTLKAIQTSSLQRKKITTIESTDLTTREKEVLILICKELVSSEIADRLFVSVRTVEGHRNNLLVKTQSRNIAGLVFYAIKHSLIEVF